MELGKQSIRTNRPKGMTSTQITLERDVNVPDAKPDMRQIISRRKDIKIDLIKAQNGKVLVKGKMVYLVLYRTGSGDAGGYDRLQGELPFEESINLDTVQDGDTIHIWWEIEDFHVGMINSRKMSCKSIVILHISCESEWEQEISCDCIDDKPVETRKEPLDVTQLITRKKDIYRVKEELELPAAKPAIREIIWERKELRNCETRLAENALLLSGDLLVNLLYRPEEDAPLQWYEQSTHFHGSLDLSGCHADMIPWVEVRISDGEIEQKPDADGEQRVIGVDVVLELDIRVYEEAKISLLTDVYSAVRNLVPVKEKAQFEHLVTKNRIRCKLSEKEKLTGSDGHILQICFCSGEVKLDDTEQKGQTVTMEGIVRGEILCATSDDSMPIASIPVEMPFSQTLELAEAGTHPIYTVRPSLEQLSAIMVGSDEVEMKAVVLLDVAVMEKLEPEYVSEVKEEPFDVETLQNIPGIVCYRVKEGDTLWQIAKQYYTTAASIREMNQLKNDTLLPGRRILIVKELSGLSQSG